MSTETGTRHDAGEPGLVSVIVTAYNQRHFLLDTLESVAAQSYRPIECIIVDDGSTDGTPETVNQFVTRHGHALRIKSIRQDNRGAQYARNVGISATSGEYIQFLDGDDLLDSKKIRIQVDALSSANGRDLDAVYGDSKWLEEMHDGFQVGEEIGMGPSSDVFESMLDQRWNPMFSYLCRRTAVQRNGAWTPSVLIAQDVDYFLRMAGRGSRFAYVPVMTGLYRKHRGPRISDGRMTLRARTMLAILKSTEELSEQSGMLTPRRRQALARAYRRVSYWSFGLDRSVWNESLTNFLRLCPDLPPETLPARYLQSMVGVRRSERVLGVLREGKRRLMESLNQRRIRQYRGV